MSGARTPGTLAGPAAGQDADGSAPMLEVRGVRKSFGGVKALNGVDLTVGRGTISGLIGPNGAGKSTLFNVVTGIVRPDEGTLAMAGQVLADATLEKMARRGVGRTFQSPRGFSSMTVLENLQVVPPSPGESLVGGLLGRRGDRRGRLARASGVLERLGLTAVRDTPFDELSGGELRLLEIGRHLMRDIEVLLLDEPTAGVSPAMQDRIAGVVRDLHADGITVLIVEHNLRFVFGVASEIAVMVQGAVIFSGTPEDVQHHPEVIAAYLGEGQK